jgi:hypothetical protein
VVSTAMEAATVEANAVPATMPAAAEAKPDHGAIIWAGAVAAVVGAITEVIGVTRHRGRSGDSGTPRVRDETECAKREIVSGIP